MRPVLAELIELLKLERLEQHLFRGQSQDLGWGAIYGGQALAQALSAAAQTVPEERQVHSLHGYFLRQGDASRPVIYEVDPIRDGKSFATRRVVGIQGGRAIFNLSASFQIEEPGFDHQTDLDTSALEGPEGLLAEHELARSIVDQIPEPLRPRATAERPIEARVVRPTNPYRPVAREPVKQVWYRAVDPLGDDLLVHKALLTYSSDFHFLTTALNPHGVSGWVSGIQIASLDHAMWFHRPFRMDQWLLHVIESPSASNARGLVLGRYYDQQGRLVASTAQEGLIRQR